MKRYWFIFIALLFSVIAVCQEVEKAINEAVQDENYSEAITLLEGLLQDSKVSSNLYSHLGYAYYKEGDLAHSMLNYERALKLSPGNRDIVASIDLVRSQLPVRITNIPDFILVRWYDNLANVMSSSLWSIVQLLSIAALAILLYRWFFQRRESSWPAKRWIGLGSILFVSLVIVLLTSQKRDLERGTDFAISLKSQMIYQAPDERSEQVVDLGPGNKVYILDEIKQWYKVQLADKDIGWCKKENLEII